SSVSSSSSSRSRASTFPSTTDLSCWVTTSRPANLLSTPPSRGFEAVALLGLVNVVATFFAFRWIDRVGRRKLAIGGYLGMAVFIMFAAWGVAYLTELPRVWVVMVGFSFFITSFALLAVAFVARFLPETKGLSLEEVTALFEREATSST